MTSRASWATGLLVAGCLWLAVGAFFALGSVRTEAGPCGSVVAPSGNDDAVSGPACAEARASRAGAVLVAGPTGAALIGGGIALRRAARRQPRSASSAASTS